MKRKPTGFLTIQRKHGRRRGKDVIPLFASTRKKQKRTIAMVATQPQIGVPKKYEKLYQKFSRECDKKEQELINNGYSVWFGSYKRENAEKKAQEYKDKGYTIKIQKAFDGMEENGKPLFNYEVFVFEPLAFTPMQKEALSKYPNTTFVKFVEKDGKDGNQAIHRGWAKLKTKNGKTYYLTRTGEFVNIDDVGYHIEV